MRGADAPWPMRRALAAILALAFLPCAAAGSESKPELTDARGDQDHPAHDLLAVWLEDAPGGVRFTMKVASLPSAPSMHLYWFGFTLRGEDHSIGIGFDGDRRLRTSTDTPSGWFHAIDESLRDVRFQPGTPAYVSAVLPHSRLGTSEGSVLAALAAGAAYVPEGQREWVSGVDTMSNLLASYRVGGGSGPLLAFLDAPGVTPAVLVATTLGGAWAGHRLSRARSDHGRPR